MQAQADPGSPGTEKSLSASCGIVRDHRKWGVGVVTTGEAGASAQAQLAALSAVLRRHGLPMAERLDVVLEGPEAKVREFLTSSELWGQTGSIVYHAGLAGSWEARLDCEHAFSALGEVADRPRVCERRRDALGRVLQATARVSPAFRRTACYGATHCAWLLHAWWPGRSRGRALGCPGSVAGPARRRAPYRCRVGVAYLVAASSLRLDLDLWVVLFPTLAELLFLSPVWWFAVRGRAAPLKALGFVGFPLWVVAMGVGLLFGYFMFSGLYGTLLSYFGLEIQADLTPDRGAPVESLAAGLHRRGRGSGGGGDVLPGLRVRRSARSLRLAMGGGHQFRLVRGGPPGAHLLHPRLRVGLHLRATSISVPARRGRG